MQTLSKSKSKVGAVQLPGLSIQVKKLPISVRTTGETDTGYDLPVGAIVQAVYLDIDTAEATASTKTIDVGLLSSESGGDADGFLVAASTATAGTVQGLLAGTDTLGALSKEDTNGSSVFVRKPHIVSSTARSVTYTLGEATTELVGSIVILFYTL